jgi:hypothetical protein
METTLIFTVMTMAFLLNACTISAPTYKNLNQSPQDAELSFESDFELHSFFSIKIGCGKFETVGYLLKADSIFLIDKPNKEIKVPVPTGHIIGTKGEYSYSAPGGPAMYGAPGTPSITTSCSPPPHYFTPQPNGKYVVRLNVSNNKENDWRGRKETFCYLSIEQVDNNGNKKKVESNAAPICAK